MIHDDEKKMEALLDEYEGLIIATTKRWRDAITFDLDDEDIKQELRLKAWRALNSFDAAKWSGNMPDKEKERRHVFGAILNRVKDLTDKKKREEELLVAEFFESRPTQRIQVHCSAMGSNSSEGFSFIASEPVASVTWILEHRSVDSDHHVLAGLTDLQQRIALLRDLGYSVKELEGMLCMSESQLRSECKLIKSHYQRYLAG